MPASRKNAMIITGFKPPPNRFAIRIQLSSLSELIRSAQAVIGASAKNQRTATSAAAATTPTTTSMPPLTRTSRISSPTAPKSRAS